MIVIFIRTGFKKMPTTCCGCDFMKWNSHIIWKDAQQAIQGGWVCSISGQICDNTKREEHCPLVEI